MRSYLYVPGDAPQKLDKALHRGADALIVDLEDAVPAAGKDRARALVAEWLGALPATGRPAVWVRVNTGPAGEADARAVAGPNLAGVCLAKADSPAQVAALGVALAGAEEACGLPVGTIAVVPLLESAAAVLAAPAIARAPRVARLQIGEADLRAELGVTLGPDERELLFVRSQVVLAAAAAGIAPPVAPVSTDYRDLAALRASTVALRRLGFLGRACIHPAQVEVVNEVFTPTPQELAAAADLVRRFDDAVGSGAGVLVDVDGRMVDAAVVRAARRLLTLAP
ncbi:CoA ester lyase [Dactylosporangium aurantiacum]|uniref:CoA ester lyase n=1 Tax=Dactylosporangium aurantiacum TaxID=35754 RepID=A0A9Q9IB48_9ACTN|nr:CoA ester lyase [Dactylosporangium aurantiacum]MDG6103651.1 CoA ester lyase [Dactylosporangium aurantiacum]UWZ51861.1 CoA ester lyase [Dactylosporangium aurantiacum]